MQFNTQKSNLYASEHQAVLNAAAHLLRPSRGGSDQALHRKSLDSSFHDDLQYQDTESVDVRFHREHAIHCIFRRHVASEGHDLTSQRESASSKGPNPPCPILLSAEKLSVAARIASRSNNGRSRSFSLLILLSFIRRSCPVLSAECFSGSGCHVGPTTWCQFGLTLCARLVPPETTVDNHPQKKHARNSGDDADHHAPVWTLMVS